MKDPVTDPVPDPVPDPVTEPVIRLRGLNRRFSIGGEEVLALKEIDLQICRGEFVAIMGASGSGKSTLMNLMGCLDQPSEGTYLFEGRDVSTLSEPDLAQVRSDRIGFVFQSFNLLPRTSALENVILPLLYGRSATLSARERAETGRRALARVGLTDRERNTPAQLSGGQHQRVALARALISRPAVLLADEPTGNLDTRTSHEIMDIIVRLNRDEGLTVLVVTHEPDIGAYADRVITMRDGAIVSDERQRTAASASRPVPEAVSAPRPSAEPVLPFAFLGMIATAALQALSRNRMRSALTMLGVFIGVAALIAMVAVGDGAASAVKQQLESLGTNMIVVQPGAVSGSGARGGAGSASTLTVADALALGQQAPAVLRVGYLSRQSGQVVFGDQNWSTAVQGVSPSYLAIVNWRIASGEPLTDPENDAAEKVAVIGHTVMINLFGEGVDPVGATLLVRGVPLRIVGVLATKGQTGYGQDQDDVVLVPFATAERKVLGVASPQSGTNPISAAYPVPTNPFGIAPRLTGYVNSIYVQAAAPDQVQAAIAQANRILARRHRIEAGQPNNFTVRNLSQIADAQESSSEALRALLALVASISLVVGGIGIMNILLVSVTERTREIGVRMALGARRLQVLLQFLLEAVFLSLTGGAAGVVVGVGASLSIARLAHWPIQISPVAIVGGFLFSAVVGIFFGYYPAAKAARLNPIEALRFE